MGEASIGSIKTVACDPTRVSQQPDEPKSQCRILKLAFPGPVVEPGRGRYSSAHRGNREARRKARSFPSRGTRRGIGLAYGISRLALVDRFRFEADGGILGHTYSDTRANSVVTGPQVGIVGFESLGPLTFYAHVLVVMGVNEGAMRQHNGIGDELVPGATNRPLYSPSTHSEHRASSDEFAPATVYWLEASLQLTEHTSLKATVSGIHINNILLAADRVHYYLPDMGLLDPGEQHYAQQQIYCGIEMVR